MSAPSLQTAQQHLSHKRFRGADRCRRSCVRTGHRLRYPAPSLSCCAACRCFRPGDTCVGPRWLGNENIDGRPVDRMHMWRSMDGVHGCNVTNSCRRKERDMHPLRQSYTSMDPSSEPTRSRRPLGLKRVMVTARCRNEISRQHSSVSASHTVTCRPQTSHS
eukprot:15370-Rhodomonas_salina.3